MSDKTYNRSINIFINGKEVENNLRAIEKEYFKLRNEVAGLVKGSAEYNQKVAELGKIRGILNDHKAAINGTKSAWDKAKEGITGFVGKIAGIAGIAYGAWKGIKSVIDSSERLSDGWDKLVGGAKEMFNEFKLAIANVDFSNFIEGLREAWERGRDLAEELDKLSDFKAYQDYKISQLNRESRALQETTKDRDMDQASRLAAANEREKIEIQIFDRSVEIAERTYALEKKSWKGRNKMAVEEAKALYETYLSIPQIQLEALEQWWDLNGGKKKSREKLLATGAGAHFRGISAKTKKAFADFKVLEENSLSEFLIQLFRASMVYENAIADAHQRLSMVKKERSGITEDDSGIPGLDKKSIEQTMMDLRQIVDAETKKMDTATEERRKEWMQSVADDAEFRIKVDKETNDKLTEQRNELIAIEKKQFEDKVKLYVEYASAIGVELGTMLAQEKLTAEQAARQLLAIAVRSLRDFANVYIAQGMMREVGSKGFIGFGTGLALTVIINTILSGVEAKLKSGLYTGGFTGWGGQYEPAGTVSGRKVHGQEWVANRSMVSSPVYGPMIQALEQVQRSGMATGGYAGSAAAAAGQVTTRLTDPALTSAINRLNRLLDKLDASGVNMNFGMREAHGVRKSMNKLLDLESSVSL